MSLRNCTKIVRHLMLAALLVSAAAAVAQPFTIIANPYSPIESRYIAFFKEELAKRSAARVTTAATLDGVTGDALVLSSPGHLPELIGRSGYSLWIKSKEDPKLPYGPETFSVTPLLIHGHRDLVLVAEHGRGQLFALGWFLRHATATSDSIRLPESEAFVTSPEKSVRGYQIGYRMKNNTYDAWTLAQFRQQMLDMAVFGMNTMQVISPFSDDAAASPLFHASAKQTIVGLSEMSQEYGLRFDLYYPEMANDYTDPKLFAADLRQFESLVQSLPLVDSVHIPGGDPGHTPPAALMPLVEQEAKILHRYHPQAGIWISAQGFNAERYEQFYRIMQANPSYITGVFFGPQSREGMDLQRRKIPARYPIEFYPDTAHVMHAEFPVPEWDPAYALTEGREPICPRPEAFEHISRHFQALNSGSIVYSEGVNDDVNKALWASWGWKTGVSSHEILREYARYFFAANEGDAERSARAIENLEKNWTGPLLKNTQIEPTLREIEELHPRLATQNWRWDSLLYRAQYDRYVQIKRRRELAAEIAALSLLEDDRPASDRIAAARAELAATQPDAEEQRLHEGLGLLAAALYKECGLQLSVKLYGASNWERGANFDRIDTPLNDRAWIEARLAAASAMSGSAQLAALTEIANWQRPGTDALYDDLGDPANEPHLVRGEGWIADPEMYRTAIDGIADETLEKGWRLSWIDYAETLYEQPLRLHYENLEPDHAYRIRVTYAGEAYATPMEMRANGLVIQPLRMRTSNPEQVEFEIPASAMKGLQLTIEWNRSPGAGGSGRGGQVAEVWLLKRFRKP